MMSILDELKEEASASKKRMDEKRELNRQFEQQSFMERIDRMTEEFLESNRSSREGTRLAAEADERAGKSGRGVDWGSWGSVDGMEVVVSGENERGGVLLGSADAARRRDEGGDLPMGEIVEENRVLVVGDLQKVSFCVVAGDGIECVVTSAVKLTHIFTTFTY
jgi:hypothetical protein